MIKQQQECCKEQCFVTEISLNFRFYFLTWWMDGKFWPALALPSVGRWLPTEICFGPTTFTLVQVLPKTSTHAAQVPRTNEYAFPPSGQQKPASLVVDPHNFDCTLARILIYKQETLAWRFSVTNDHQCHTQMGDNMRAGVKGKMQLTSCP